MAYMINKGDAAQRRSVAESLVGLRDLAPGRHEPVITAWTTAWLGSPYQSLTDIPYSLIAGDYRLFDHINDVTRMGLTLARQAQADWGDRFDLDTLLEILILHDVDKPLIYQKTAEGMKLSELGRQLPHGVVGGMMLRELGFSHEVVATVSTHAFDAPFHNDNFYAYVLHYADMFATDHVMRLSGVKPFYMRK
jgi:putative nucleotidyltransferase with HDIG domain